MRSNQKQQVLDLITTIEEGVQYARHTEQTHSINMLQDCYEGLNFLMSMMGEYSALQSQIQEIIQKVEGVMSNLEKNDRLNSELEQLSSMIEDVRAKANEQIKTKIEIAFMPYKASMWDSLDSIYRAAKDDPDCICHVVPIPYYEKDEHGEITRFCYEGNQLPNDIKTIPFDVYDFESTQPDIIYIHNPFDQYNTLTMVNPRFFSENLAKYTKELVYIPYYVAGSSETSTTSVLPSYHHITKIVVQSNNAKKVLVAKGIGENKVLDLGSPKIDGMYRALDGEVEVPHYWMQVIKEKQVFLLNTGIADLLSINMWFAQINQTINFFIEHDQYALIWRPHPLTEITLQTMRPYLMDIYIQLENKLKQASNIIVDRNHDIYPAVSVSDALISDYSSVMLQYIVTGKPVLGLLSKEMIKPERYYHADYLGCYFTNQGMTVPQFVEMVEHGRDSKQEERMNRFKNSISNADGTCGEMIHRSIKEEIMRVCKDKGMLDEEGERSYVLR